MEEKKNMYKFTKVPMNLMMLLDVNCRSMLFTLCQLASYFEDVNGLFFRTNADLSLESQLSEKLVRATVDTLYSNGIIEVWSVGKGKGKHSNYYRLNYEKFEEYDKYNLEELKNPTLQISTIKGYNEKGYSPSYLKNEYSDIPKDSPTVPQELPKDFPSFPQITNNIDNIEIIDNINIKENIDIKDNIEIEDNNIIDIEERYKERINELFDKNYTIPKIFKELASTDWECYQYFKNSLKENEGTKSIWKENLELLYELNDKYEP